ATVESELLEGERQPAFAHPFTAASAASGVFSITVRRSGRSPRARMTGAGSGSTPMTSETKAPNLDGWAVDRATMGAPLRSRRRAAARATAVCGQTTRPQVAWAWAISAFVVASSTDTAETSARKLDRK